MTKAQFVRWANRREQAADALREAKRLMVEMTAISGGAEPVVDLVDDAWSAAGDAVKKLSAALDVATGSAPPTGEGAT